MREPQTLLAAGGKAGESAILDFVSAQPRGVEMRKHRVAVGVDPQAARKPRRYQYGRRHTARALQIGIPLWVGHAAVRAFDTHPIRAAWLQRGKLRWGGRSADPGPQDLAHCTEVQVLAPLQEIDNGAVVPVIPHREENVMAIGVALDYNLVRVAPQHRASPPVLAPVQFIAETDGKLAQIHLPFEGIEFAIPIHKNTFSFPIAHFSFPAATELLALCRRTRRQLGAPTARAALEHVPVMQQAVQHGRHGGHIAQQFAPVLNRTIRSEQRARPLVAPHDDFQQILGRRQRQLAHAEIVDDEWGHTGHRLHELFARTLGYGLGQMIQQHVRFPVRHPVVLLNSSPADGLGQVTLARAAGPRNKASSRFPMKAQVARSKTRLRFIFGLKLKSNWSRVLCASRNSACLRRRSSNCSLRRLNSSLIRHEIRSMGAMASLWACRSRVSSTAATSAEPELP